MLEVRNSMCVAGQGMHVVEEKVCVVWEAVQR